MLCRSIRMIWGAGESGPFQRPVEDVASHAAFFIGPASKLALLAHIEFHTANFKEALLTRLLSVL